MPTWDELDQQAEVREAARQEKNRAGVRTAGACFIRQPGQKLPPVLAAKRENRRRKKQAAEMRRHAAEQDVVAKSQKALLLMDLRLQGIAEEEAERVAEETYKKQLAVQKSSEQMRNEMRINDEATRIFNAWDDDGDGQLNPAELRQALALAGFNTGTSFVEDIMDEFDTDGDGMMDLDEFKIMMHVLYAGERKRGWAESLRLAVLGNAHAIYGSETLTDREIERYKAIFHDADESGDMLLDEGELQHLLVNTGFMHGQRKFVYDAMRTMDTSGDGAIDFGEFLEFMVKIKEMYAASQGFLATMRLGGTGSAGSDTPAPPLPPMIEAGYFKVARYVPSVAPTFERRWCQMMPNGHLYVADTRGGVMRMAEKPYSFAANTGRSYDKKGSIVIDLAYVDEVRPSPTGNASKCKFDVITLTDVWYFKAENKESCAAWIPALVAWRDHLAFKYYCRASGTPFTDVPGADAVGRQPGPPPSGVGASARKSRATTEGSFTRRSESRVGASSFETPQKVRSPLARSNSKASSFGSRRSLRSASQMSATEDSFDDDDDDEDPDSGTDEEESVHGSMRD